MWNWRCGRGGLFMEPRAEVLEDPEAGCVRPRQADCNLPCCRMWANITLFPLYCFLSFQLCTDPAPCPSPVSKAKQLMPSFCIQFIRWRCFAMWKPSAQTNAKQIMWSKATEPRSWETNSHYFLQFYISGNTTLQKSIYLTHRRAEPCSLRPMLHSACCPCKWQQAETRAVRPQPHSSPPPPCYSKRSNRPVEMAQPSESWGALAPISITFLSSLKTNQRKPGWFRTN